MGLKSWFAKAETTANESIGDIYSPPNQDHGIFKSYIPEFLYKPPFGYPRKENIPLIRQLAKNPYIFSVVKTLCDEVASTSYDINLKEDVEMTPELEKMQKEMLKFFSNPNGNKESFNHLLRAITKDILEVDSGVWVKVFNRKQEFCQLFARDGGSFLKNPDIYGYLGDKEDFIEPIAINYLVTPENPMYPQMLKQYELAHKETAAYFQYGWTAASLPVPFGKREIIYMMQNPQSNNIYGLSPVQILADIIMTLVYGANYNLDFYMNNNMPEGIITLIDANQEQITAFRKRMDKVTRVEDKATGFWRKIAFKIPIVSKESKFTPFQLDPKVMQILEQQEWFTKIVWMCFGITPDEMGFTESSNKAVSQTQFQVYKRKAIKPVLEVIKYHINMEIIPEWGEIAFESFEFKWNDYDLDEDIKQHNLYKQQLDMGIKTPEMIAEEEGIEFDKVKEYKEENDAKELEKAQAQGTQFNQSFNEGKEPFKKEEKKPEVKADKYESELEEELVTAIRERGKEIKAALEQYKKGQLDKVR